MECLFIRNVKRWFESPKYSELDGTNKNSTFDFANISIKKSTFANGSEAGRFHCIQFHGSSWVKY